MFRIHSSTYKTVYTDACETYCTIPVYKDIPEDEPSGSKHVDGIKKLKY